MLTTETYQISRVRRVPEATSKSLVRKSLVLYCEFMTNVRSEKSHRMQVVAHQYRINQ